MKESIRKIVPNIYSRRKLNDISWPHNGAYLERELSEYAPFVHDVHRCVETLQNARMLKKSDGSNIRYVSGKSTS